jgi:hypothetical protein
VRIEIAEPGIKGSVQPYHAAKYLEFNKAREFLDRCGKASLGMAKSAISDLIRSHSVTACAILMGSGRATGTIEATLASHAAIHTAEGEFFREAIAQAALECGLDCRKIREKELFAIAQREFRIDVRDWVEGLRKSLGPPWTQDEKYAAMAGWLALGKD